MGIRISKDHLHPSVIESITSLIGDLSQLETTAKGNAVEAINELLANGGNKEELEALIAEIAEGKELIANAVGEPLTAEESFDEMSNDINSLLSTFKTNMMNNGITVESGDKFKSLIDKIATLTDNESKGMRCKEAVIPVSGNYVKISGDTNDLIYLKIPLDFEPTMMGIKYSNRFGLYDKNDNSTYFYDNSLSKYYNLKHDVYYEDNYYLMPLGTSSSGGSAHICAIGVGEEDTTLRDSLASILQEEGVSVTEEDDMASLISKVDEKFNNDLIPTVMIDDTACLLSYPMISEGYGEYYPDTPAFEYTCFFNGSVRFKADIMGMGDNEYYEYTYRLTVIDKLGNYIYDTTDVLNETSVNYLSHDLSNITSGSRIQLFLLSSTGQMHGWAHPYNIYIYGKTI